VLRTTGLNLGFLRRKGPGAGQAPQDSGGISRRDLFRLAGGVTIVAGFSSATRAAGLKESGTFDLATERERASFLIDGKEAWVIDTRNFGGKPSLTVDRSAQGIRLALRDATFPGTDLPADLSADILPQANHRWTMRLRMALGGFAGEVPFVAWLTGQAALRGKVDLSLRAATLGAAAELRLSGSAKAEFLSTWTMRISGAKVARVTGLGDGDLLAHSLAISLRQAGDPSLLNMPPARRTFIALDRGDLTWHLGSAFQTPAGWQLLAPGQAFDALYMEAGLNKTGEARRVLVAESVAAGERAVLEAANGLKGKNGGNFQLSLNNLRFAVGVEKDGTLSTALLADAAKEPTWLHAAGCSVLVGGGDESGSALELMTRGGQLTRATCAPVMQGLSAPMAGAVVEPLTLDAGPKLKLFDFKLKPAATSDGPTNGNQIDNPSPNDNIIVRPNLDIIAAPIFIPLNYTVSVLRPEDLLVLRFEFVNLTLRTSATEAAKLTRTQANKPAYVVVHFQPQHIAERAFFETETPGSPGDETPAAPPVASRMAGPSRLAFLVPNAVTEIPYDLPMLLSWAEYRLSTAPNAAAPPLALPVKVTTNRLTGIVETSDDDCDCEIATVDMFPAPKVEKPAEHFTAIEAPYRVIISPNKYGGWAHAKAPVTHDGATELWHTRLGVRDNNRVDEQSTAMRTVRAIWSPDFNASAPPPASGDTSPFRMSLTSAQRNQIVRLTSDFQIPNYRPKPVKVDRLMLTSLGAWMNVHGQFSPFGAFTLEEWRHRAVMGRDTYVRVVEKGYLFPLGHRASLITITERKFQPTPSGATAAYLRQRKFIIVREPEKTYPGTGQSFGGRKLPFRSIRLTSLTTPNIDLPAPIVPGSGESSFWVRVGGQDFNFHAVMEDIEGRKLDLTVGLAFIKSDISNDQAKMATVAQNFATGPAGRRTRSMNGQTMAFAVPTKPGDTAFPTRSLTFGGDVPDQSSALSTDAPRFFPAMEEAEINIESVERMTGQPAQARIAMAQAYLQSGFDANVNKSQVFAEVKNAVKQMFPANMAGGVATPNTNIGGLSKLLGPVGGAVSDIVGGNFDPEKFLSDEAKILGGILLSKIIQALNLAEAGNTDKVPKLTARVVYPEGADGKENPDGVPLGVETNLTWTPRVKDDPTHIFKTMDDTSLRITGRFFVSFDGGSPTYQIRGELKHFKIDLIAPVTSFIIVEFKELIFTASDGSKPDLKPEIADVKFVGPLSFVNALQSFLKSKTGGGGGSGLSVDISPAGVKAGYTLAIPNLTLGVLAIQNMSLSAGLHIPFNGDPVRLRFAFCERQNPFLLTVSCFGGGGFFGIGLGLDGIELLEASFEFGGNFALDIGVASGGVYIMAGIYYKMEGDDATLTGYLKMGGSLEILGIITISVEFYMSLTYDIPNDKVWGQAKLTVKVEILFFSASVELSVERKFKGSNGDPLFADLMDKPHWDEYCLAYAND